MNKTNRVILPTVLMLLSFISFGQKGSLFIIGGGERTPDLMKELMLTADFRPGDYIVVLPMASGVAEETVDIMKKQFQALGTNAVTSFNFSKTQADEQQGWIDSVRNARLIYITGGDQNRFMDVVKGTKLYQALHDAYAAGSTISGTSAGAAVMSEVMITGSRKGTEDTGDFKEVKTDQVGTAQGMGFLKNAIIDQHFIRRSRYNRLLSAQLDFPRKMLIGIDESTAIVVRGKQVRVVGESQVVVLAHPRRIKLSRKRVAGMKAQIWLLTEGDTFKL